MKTVGYLRVSTGKQETEKNKHDILKFANDKDLGKVVFVEETASGAKDWRKRKIAEILEVSQKGDTLIVPELSRLGRSTLGILEILKVAREKGISVYAVKGGWTLDGSMQSRMMATLFAMLAEVERDLISARTKEALAAAKKKGVKLGRKPLSEGGERSSKLDKSAPEIKALLAQGSMVKYVAERYGVKSSSLIRWLQRRGIDRAELMKGSLSKAKAKK